MSLELRISPAGMPAKEVARAVALLCAYLSPADLTPIAKTFGATAAPAGRSSPSLTRAELTRAINAAGVDSLAGVADHELAEKIFAAAAGVIGDDNPEAGTPSPDEAFAESPIPPEVVVALAPSIPPAGPSPEAAFGGNVPPLPAGIAPGPVGTPAAPPAPVVSAPLAGSVDLDAKGLPWDSRIHAKSSSGPGGVKNADGTWRAKRGLNDGALVARVEAELRAVMAAPGPSAAPLTPPATPDPTPTIPAPPLPVAPAPLAPVPAPPVAAPAAPAVGGLVPTSSYVELVQQIAKAMGEGKLTEAEITGACAAVGIPGLPLLATRLDLVAGVSAGINQILATRA